MALESFSPLNGIILDGGFEDLGADDDSFLRFGFNPLNSRNRSDASCVITTKTYDVHPDKFVVQITNKVKYSGTQQTVELWDWNQNRYIEFGKSIVGPLKNTSTYTKSTGSEAFVNQDTREVKLRLSYKPSGFGSDMWIDFDKISFKVTR